MLIGKSYIAKVNAPIKNPIMRTAPYSKRSAFTASLFAEPVVAAALVVPDVFDPVKSTVRFETGNDCDVSARVIPVPFVQKLEVPGLFGVNRTPAHYRQPASI